MKVIFPILLTILVSAGCTAASSTEPGETNNKSFDAESVFFGSPVNQQDAANLITAVEIDGDVLLIDVQYEGPRGAEFDLYWDGRVDTAFPPRVEVVLAHDPLEEGHEQLAYETLEFDLSVIRYFYQTNYNSEEGVMVINLADFSVEYAYDEIEIDEELNPQGTFFIAEPLGTDMANDEVVGLSVSSETLTVDVQYDSECKTHAFALFWDGVALDEGTVLGTSLKMTRTPFEHEGDCETGLTAQSVEFDLSEMRQAFTDAYGDSGEIAIHLSGKSTLFSFGRKRVVLAGSAIPAPDAAPGTVTELAIDGDTLLIEATYEGGCGEHDFGLVWQDGFLQSDPPQARLTLTHQSPDDACESLVFKNLEFDLSAIRSRYTALLHDGAATVVLLIDGNEIEYSF